MRRLSHLIVVGVITTVLLLVLAEATEGPADVASQAAAAPAVAPEDVPNRAQDTTPIVFSSTIRGGVPVLMGDTDVILEFAPQATGVVTVTLVPTTPVAGPPGASALTWHFTTTATDYEVIATFKTHRLAQQAETADVGLLLDRSGSMELDTLCYGCWTPSEGDAYPDGDRWPLPWNGPATGSPAHCSATTSPLAYADHSYIIIEAEEYSRSSVPYSRDVYVRGMSYWVLQRNGGSDLPQLVDDNAYLRNDNGAGALGRDLTGAYVSHHPQRSYWGSLGNGPNCTWSDLLQDEMCLRGEWALALGGPFPNPRLDYDFEVPTSTTWHVWARGIGGDSARNIMWGLDRVPWGNTTWDGDTQFYGGIIYNGADRDQWR